MTTQTPSEIELAIAWNKGWLDGSWGRPIDAKHVTATEYINGYRAGALFK